MVPTTLPEPVAALLAAALPGAAVADLAPTVGGFSNLTVAATINGRPFVIKAAERPAKRDDLRREYAVLTALRGQHLGSPTAVTFAEGHGWAVLVMHRRTGTPGLSLYGHTGAPLAQICRALGSALARLHTHAALTITDPTDPLGLRIGPRAAALGKLLAELPVPEDLRRPLATALTHPIWHTGPAHLVHGDAGLHNLLWSDRGVTLLDWEWAGLGRPQLDLAWVAWTLRFRGVDKGLWQELLSGYGEGPAARTHSDGEMMHALALGQAAAILARSAGREDAWNEWVRRVRWTLDQNQIAPG